jgi:hypothetical protein
MAISQWTAFVVDDIIIHAESCWIVGGWRAKVRESNKGDPTDSIFTAELHQEIPLNTDFGIKNEGQDCKIGTM